MRICNTIGTNTQFVKQVTPSRVVINLYDIEKD